MAEQVGTCSLCRKRRERQSRRWRPARCVENEGNGGRTGGGKLLTASKTAHCVENRGNGRAGGGDLLAVLKMKGVVAEQEVEICSLRRKRKDRWSRRCRPARCVKNRENGGAGGADLLAASKMEGMAVKQEVEICSLRRKWKERWMQLLALLSQFCSSGVM
jgi:hypothetical protein